MDHTPEPWEVGADKPPFYAGETVIIGQKEGQPFILAQCNHNFDNLSKANARRIVACVNAFEGYDLRQVELIAHNGGVTTFSFETVRAMEVDRDRWKALALEAGARLKDSEDYLTESFNNVLDDSRPRYERRMNAFTKF